MMKKRKCIKCGESQEINFYPRYKGKCKACLTKEAMVYRRAHPEQRRESDARFRAKPGYEEKQSRFYKEWYAKNGRNRASNYTDVIYLWQREHPEEIEAMQKVHRAIKDGLLVKPSKCALCGREARINGHHENYDSPYAVIWVCASCHKKIHLTKIG